MSGLDGQDTPSGKWQFWIDRGGTFTDVVARTPAGTIVTRKLLSENPERYADAALQGIRELLELAPTAPIPAHRVAVVKMGTTVATNALLERTGEPTVLLITRGFADQLRIGNQARPDLFARQIVLPELLYQRVIEIDERLSAEGRVLRPLDEAAARQALAAAAGEGFRACAIVLLHSYRYPDHERRLAVLARELGFTQVSASYQVSPLMKLVGRGDTTVVDAYLTPVLQRHIERVARELGETRLLFMQSNGGLTDARRFQGKDAILSGPAGGVVGAVKAALAAGFERVIGFDMGGTSTDVCHWAGEYERTLDTVVAGVRLRAPMMHIHTVAAGGGSICSFDGSRYRVGPESAGARPGPLAYRRGGPLTVTDCNVMVGKLQPGFFPAVFGADGRQPLDAAAVKRRFEALATEIAVIAGDQRRPVEVAEGFLAIAVLNMAEAIKKISVQRGYDVTGYTLVCFGGAGGQHACQVADALGMTTVLVPPLAGVLSAYGIGQAEVTALRQRALETPLTPELAQRLPGLVRAVAAEAAAELIAQGVTAEAITVAARVQLKVQGSDSALEVPLADHEAMLAAFTEAHRRRYGFERPDQPLVLEAIAVEASGRSSPPEPAAPPVAMSSLLPYRVATVSLRSGGVDHHAPVFNREHLRPGNRIFGPSILFDRTATTVVEPGWMAEVRAGGDLVLTRIEALPRRVAVGTKVDPVMLEVFNHLFTSVAEQMGFTLENTAFSVNIKERLDFSCAIFDRKGALVANAPHIPVHLGSMGEAVRAVIGRRGHGLKPGQVVMLNDPYHGGTHLPDITVVSPVFDAAGKELLFLVASRGHHADIGGITPGSMPPASRQIAEEGVLIDDFLLVEDGRLREAEVRALLAAAAWPARNPDQNLADLKAQIAANERGIQELHLLVERFGLAAVQAYMGHVQDNAEEQVRRVLELLNDGSFVQELDNGARIAVAVTIDHVARSATIDFTGTSAQLEDNFNAPSAICRAAVMYVFRTLVEDEIPLNEGCLKPLKLVIPPGSMLAPRPPAAVVAGNVETSQALVDALFGALGVMAAAQGTMNNLTFGNQQHQYYETICGGTGAGPDFDGTSAVHSHMTNSRLTDPEVLEWRFPVLVERFAIRHGSGGAGRHRGGDGVIRRLRFREPMTAALLSNHRQVAPFGLMGGAPGALGRGWVERADGRVEPLAGTAEVEMGVDDVLVLETPGGGGYGVP